MQANWVRNNGHQTLRYGIFQIIASVTVHNVCISIARYGDVTSNSALLNFGCLKMTQPIIENLSMHMQHKAGFAILTGHNLQDTSGSTYRW